MLTDTLFSRKGRYWDVMIKDNLDGINRSLPEGVRLVAVSKTKPVSDLQEAYDAGQRLFGENYATELRDKHAVLPDDIEWHFIGHVQSKQLKYYIGFVSMIHGVDSLEHLADINRAAEKAGRVVDVLLQVHVAREETKFGFLPEELLNSQFSIVNFQFTPYSRRASLREVFLSVDSLRRPMMRAQETW